MKNTGYVVGDDGIILKTVDAGTSWTNLVSGTTDHLASVYFPDANTGYAVGVLGTILKTTNGGITWNDLSINEDIYLRSVYFSDVNTGYAVGRYVTESFENIIKTIDGGVTWTVINSGTYDVLNSVYFTDANTGYAVGGESLPDGIIKKTIDGGNTWFTLSSGTFKYLQSVFFTDANTGYAVGYGGTILKITNGDGFPTAVENITQESTFTVYPNPATKKISIATKSNLQGETTFCIFNMNGAILQQEKFQSQNLIEMDVSTMAKGIYLIKIQTKAGIETKKLVVQ